LSVIVRIPGPLRPLAAGQSQVNLKGSPATVREALELLWRAYPALRDRVVNEEGQVRGHINVFVGNESIRYLDGLATPITADAEISIIPAVSGG
jgi:sulfur-carrier protein